MIFDIYYGDQLGADGALHPSLPLALRQRWGGCFLGGHHLRGLA